MRRGRTPTPAAEAAVIGSSFLAAGKPARPCAPSAGPNTVLPSGVSYGRDTMLSGSSLGDSVSQRGEALGSLTPRVADFGQRSGHLAGRTGYFCDGKEVVSSRDAWRPPAGLPVPGSNGTTVSCNSSCVGAGSIGRSSNYAEASAAASFYKQRQQQHSPCIFGDGSDYASSVARYVPPDQTTGAELRLQQRVPFLEDGDPGSQCNKSGRQQNSQSDTVRAAGVPTATWHVQQEQQQQRKLLQTPEGMAQSLQQSQPGANLSESTEPQPKQSPQMCADETLRRQAHYQQAPMGADLQLEQTHPPPREDAAPGQQWQRETASTAAASRVEGLTDPTFLKGKSQGNTRKQQKHERSNVSTDGVAQEETLDPAREGTGLLLRCNSSNTQSQEFRYSAAEFVNPPEGSTASSGDYSPSPASPSTLQQEEHEAEVQRQQQQQHQQQLHEMPRAEDGARSHPSELDLSDKPPAQETFEAAASRCTPPPHNNRSSGQPRAEEDNEFSALRGSNYTPTPRGSKGPDVSAFVPREDPRSSREKQIQALRSSGSVMPVSVAADAAVAAAAAAASLRCHGNISGGRNFTEGCAVDTGVNGRRTSRAGPPDTQADPYPLNFMGKSSEHAGRRATARAGCARLLPLDIPWHSSAASMLGNREYLSHANAGHGAGSSPTSNGSRGLLSPASSNCSQAPHGQQLTARERLLHQHCTSSVFADEEDTSETANRRVLQGVLPSTTAATSHRALPLQECEYGTKDENLQRRADQLQNPWYSDLFGRQTPKCSPTAARCAAAAVLANAPERPSTSPGEGEDTQGAAAPAAGNAILGVDGATLDKLCAHRRKAQLLRAPNAYERFISAMQSDIWSNIGGDGDAVTQKRLMRAHLAKEMLLQEKCREQRRRQRLKEAVKEGHGKYFHMITSDEARVGEMGKNVHLLALQVKRALPPKRSTAELHLFGMRPDMTEEDIEKLCREGGGEKAEKNGDAESTSGTTTQTDGGVKSNRGLPKCSLQVKLATNILTSECKGTGKVILQYQENEVDIEQVVRRLREANVGVRQVS